MMHSTRNQANCGTAADHIYRAVFLGVALLFLSASPRALTQQLGPTKTDAQAKVRLEYKHSIKTPNYIVFQSTIYRLKGVVERDETSGLSTIQRRFGNTSLEEASIIRKSIVDTVDALEVEDHKRRKSLLCDKGSAQSKEVYYDLLNDINDAQILSMERLYTTFMGSLTNSQSVAFSEHLESRKPKVFFQALDHKSSYENSPYDVVDVVRKMCQTYGETL